MWGLSADRVLELIADRGVGEIDARVIRYLLDYQPDDGILFWKERPSKMFLPSGRYMIKTPEESAKIWNDRFAGMPALNTISKIGYRVGCIFDRQYKAHRVAYAWVNGVWPNQIDHINRDKADNRWSNLRQSDQKQNCANRLTGKPNTTSKFRGVSMRNGSWLARCQGRDIGVFCDEGDAALAYNKAAISTWGEFATLNRVGS